MNDKEFVLVSQGIEIMRTKSQENAINYVKKENDEWFDYKQRCIDNYEDYADDYIDLEIEYPEDKRYLQLQSNWNSLRECIIGVIEGAREELNTIIHTTDTSTEDGLKYVNQCSREFDVIRKNLEIPLDKMNELEGKDKE